MRICPACNAVADEKALAAGRCSKCGAALHQVPQRTLQLPADAVATDRPKDLDTVGQMSSIDIELVSDSTESPDTIQTLDLSTIPGGASAAGGLQAATVALGGEQTVEFVSGVQDPQQAESLATAQWDGNYATGVDNPQFTIKQLKTVDDSKTTHSSVVVKSRQFRSATDLGRLAATPSEAPDYELLDRIGEGGMGVVYSARQSAIARTVAVKMLKQADAARPEQREKFISEAVVTGELDHPNIVPIYDLGTNNDGALFYSMKRVKGTPWDDVLGKKSLDENLGILMRVADAVAFAHANGVIHRDLKPENVMLGDFGEVLVMDWGLARISPEFPNAASVTQSDVMGGTPAYMAPEMATGPIELVTTASDVYLLGAILYEILTGRPPHTGKSVMACLMAAAKNKVTPPAHRSELGDIAAKAMATQPADRHESVRDFQNAIRDFQAHSESILLAENADKHLKSAHDSGDYDLFARALYGYEEALALWSGNQRAGHQLAAARFQYAELALRRGDFELGISLLDPANGQHRVLLDQLQAGLAERASRLRRLTLLKRAVAALLFLVAVVVAVAFVMVRAQRDVAVEQRIRAEGAEKVAQQNYEDAEAARQVAVTEREKADQARQVAETERVRAESEEAKAVAAKQAEEYEAYIARIGLANAKVAENAFDRAWGLLEQCPASLTNWEWGRLAHLCRLHKQAWELDAPVEAVVYSPDGRSFATGGLSGEARVIDVQTGKEIGSFAAGQYVHTVAFSPNGELLAVGGSDRAIRIFDLGSKQLVKNLSGHTDAVLSVRFSADGKQLLSAGYDNVARLWDLASGENTETLQGHNWWVWSAEFSPDGERIVTASQDGKAIVWQRDPATNQHVQLTQFTQHRGPVYDAQFSPDGTQIATAGYDRRVLLWNPAEVQPVDIARRLDSVPDLPAPFVQLGEHDGPARTLVFSPDGRSLASGGQDNVIRIWNLTKNQPQQVLRGHASHVRDLAYSPDGQSLLSAGRDQEVKLWQPAAYAETLVFSGQQAGLEDAVLAAHFSPDGSRVVTASRDRTATLWDIATRQVERQFAEGHAFLASRAIFMADGSRLVTSAGDGSTRVWDVATGTELFHLENTGNTAAVGVSADGRWIATGDGENGVQVWDAHNGQRLAVLAGHVAPVTAIAFSPSGTLLATGDDRGQGRLWQLDQPSARWKLAQQLSGHSRTITAAAFTPDGRTLVTASGDNTCGLWDVATGQELRDRVLKHPQWVADMVMSADGSRVLTSCEDGQLRLWSLADSQLLQTIEPSDKPIAYTGVDLSHDGQFALAASAATGEVFLWDIASNQPVVAGGDWLGLAARGGTVWSARFAPAADNVLTIGGNDARLWDRQTRGLLVRFSPHGAVADAVLSPDGQLLATASWDRSAKIWDTATGKALRKLDGVHQGYINSVAFSPDGRQILTASDDQTVRLWDAATAQPLDVAFTGHTGRVRQARFNSDGKRVLTVSSDKTARVWNASDGEQQLVLSGHEWAVLCGEFSRDGLRIITGGEDNVAIVWDAITGGQLLRLAGHTDSVTAVAFSPDATLAITGSQDNTVKLWDARTGKEILTLLGHREEVTSVSFSPDGLTVLTSGRDGQTILWPAREWARE